MLRGRCAVRQPDFVARLGRSGVASSCVCTCPERHVPLHGRARARYESLRLLRLFAAPACRVSEIVSRLLSAGTAREVSTSVFVYTVARPPWPNPYASILGPTTPTVNAN